ncbi:ferredoxin [Aliiroseovarius subalbicans]|uniref:ferredoxin n=1 Tax=Aliiroseovarius subalbicans TaxID=2925840 RepID=UPI001F5641A0|nr:ferredoxin [Aliiroseovarius subalbicans]MCI2401105.1 ferredoxin [Aliiroseovarius subalbicans]
MLDPTPESAQLEVFGILHDAGDTIVLLGPHEPGFWAEFSASPEYLDDAPDPLDRWSKRVIGALAAAWGGMAVFPSDGPPYPPFLAWAQASGRAWSSPVGMLVHDRAGLMVSYRGAVRLAGVMNLLETGGIPCTDCADTPCRTACPVDALSPRGYDVATCHAHLDTSEGQNCLTQGCVARRACPLSASYGRLPVQSEFHMKAFHQT